MKESGIYGILNNIDFKIYIGSTTDFTKRKSKHFNSLRKNKHENEYLQRAFNKYKEENFSFIILEHVILEKLIERELYWINQKDSLNREKGYNLAIPDINTKFKHNEETKEKNRRLTYIQHYGEIIDENKYNEWKNNLKQKKLFYKKREDTTILVLDKLTGNIINEYKTSGLAAKDLGYKNSKKIQRVLNGERIAYNDLIFIYKRNYNLNKNYAITTRFREDRSHKVLQYDLNMNLIKEWNSCKEVVSELNLNILSLRTSCTKNTKYKNSFWKIKK